MRLTRSLVATLAVASFVLPATGAGASARSPRVAEADPITFERVGSPDRTYTAVLSRSGHVAFTLSGNGDRGYEERALLWDEGVTTPLTPATGPYATVPTAVNEHRTVVGHYWHLDGARGGGPFVWNDGVMRLLGQPGDRSASAVDVNERGEVLLNRLATGASRYRASTDRQGRERVSPDVLDGRTLIGASINNSGQVAASAETGGLLPQQPHRLARQAFVWKPGRAPVALDNVAGALSTQSREINNAGTVIGALVTADQERRTFLWRDGRMVDLGTLGGGDTLLPAGGRNLNERDQVVGYSQRSDGAFHAYRWTDGEMVDLGTLGGGYSEAKGLNSRGDVVGVSETTRGGHSAFLWREGRMIDLGATVPGALYSRADAINNRGQVLGSVSTAAGDEVVVWDTLGRG